MNEIDNKEKQTEIKDNSKRAKILIQIFWILTGLTVVSVIFNYYELEILKKALLGEYIDEDKAYANDLRQGIIGLLQTGLYITSIIVFLNWFRRAYGNLHRLKLRLNHSETMAVWAFFIPIIFLFRPYQIMKEIWSST